MKIKEYFKNLPERWSAVFLALLSSTFLLSFVTWLFVALVELGFKAASFSEYFKLVSKLLPYGIFTLIIFFPAACYILVHIFIFYIFIIVSKKKWCIIVSILSILFFVSKIFIEYKNIMGNTGFGDFVFFYLFPMTIIGVPISIGIYLILLLLELIPKFRVPQSPVSQSSIFKKYIQFFYWLYFVIILVILAIIYYIMFLR